MKYVLLFLGSREQQEAWEQESQDDRAKQYEQVGRWFAEHSGKLGHGNQLQPPQTATSVRRQPNGEVIVYAAIASTGWFSRKPERASGLAMK